MNGLSFKCPAGLRPFLCPLAFVVLVACGRQKIQVTCISDSDCPADARSCDGQLVKCSDGVYAALGGMCRNDLHQKKTGEACTTALDCTSSVCLPCDSYSCPTCSHPVPGCATGPGFCDTRVCIPDVQVIDCVPPCHVGGLCGTLKVYFYACPDGGVQDATFDGVTVDSSNVDP